MVVEGELLWRPSAAFAKRSNISRFQAWLLNHRGLVFDDYEALWQWSVDDLEAFWSAMWEYFDVCSDVPYESVLQGEGVSGVRWFTGARVNYAEHLLRYEAEAASNEIAFYHSAETRPLDTLTWHEVGDRVRRLATGLRELGIRPGDSVVSYMPNVWETAVAMLACISIGAVWSAAAPEFGAKTILDRFRQISPKLIFVTDGYSFGGRIFDRDEEVAEIVEGLPSLETVVRLDFLGLSKRNLPVRTMEYAALIDRPTIAREEFAFERVASDHPLWVLFSSGTTGLPKAIVHGHAGMIVEHYKVIMLHCNLSCSTTMFFYSTTGWMMWNIVVAALIAGSSAVLYDGSPTHGGVDMLWRMAADSRTTFFGASPTLVQIMEKEGVRPRERFDLSALEAVMVGGSPSTPATFAWFYENVKRDLWLTSQSGGTEFCSGLATGVPTLPVRAGEIQARALGTDLAVWDDDRQSLLDRTGELVVLKPMPSMPLYFWGDEGGTLYHDSYFSAIPGVWRHGDLAKITREGGVYVYGRSDSTLNRHGVRIGSAEIYSVLEQVAGIRDSLVICCELPDGNYYMPLFVQLAVGVSPEDVTAQVIARALREEASPRHVPDEVYYVPEIPYTLTGKKMEVPVRKLMMGAAANVVASRDAMANPTALDWFAAFSAQPEIKVKMQSRTLA
ncbi:acetoacetyl-CoA synthetase [Sphingobium xenophagum]|uniref:Acetoacetyl-CoA synthetase n=1 Tax=Sphingobium xenophagum TaxID=121428 RepID=A0ABU1X298_SPHXE|nr:acetoacetate--CoA ligase [Sphingobium xenophagum]MDR7155705.1 acetoacetyl-CoA synthetase [Sphingobium xenophagum]